MGVKAGLFIAAIGVAIAVHAYRKNKKAKESLQHSQQSITAAPSHNSHSAAYATAGVAALGAAAYGAHHYSSSHNQQPQQQQQSVDDRPALRDPNAIYHHLVEGVIDQHLEPFYPTQNNNLRQLAQAIASSGALALIADRWEAPDGMAFDLVRLALFDIILLVDDSTSMRTGTRQAEMQSIVADIAFAAGLFDNNGIEIRFLNSQSQGNNVRSEQDVDRLLSSNPPNGVTPIGKSMRDKILQPLIVGRAQQSQLPKPALVIILTDGAATDRGQDVIQYVIRQAKDALARTRYTENALSLSFAQVGDDQYALEFLDALDKDADVGDMIDVTANQEYETKQVLKAMDKSSAMPQQWTGLKDGMKHDQALWILLFRLKRLLGGVHSWYDASDEGTPKRKRWSGTPEMAYKPHWSEQPDYIQRTEANHLSRGFGTFAAPTGNSYDSNAYQSPPAPYSQSSTAQYQQPAQYAEPSYSTPAPGYNASYQQQGAYQPSPGFQQPPPSMAYQEAYPPQGQAGFHQPDPYNQPHHQGYQQPYQPQQQQQPNGQGGYSFPMPMP